MVAEKWEPWIMLLKFPNFPDELSDNDELREFELSGSDCTCVQIRPLSYALCGMGDAHVIPY